MIVASESTLEVFFLSINIRVLNVSNDFQLVLVRSIAVKAFFSRVEDEVIAWQNKTDLFSQGPLVNIKQVYAFDLILFSTVVNIALLLVVTSSDMKATGSRTCDHFSGVEIIEAL